MAEAKKAGRLRRVGRRAGAIARRGATAVRAAGTRVVERVRRVYTGARGGVSRARGIARNAAQRARSVLSGGWGKLIAMVVGTGLMVALIPLLRRWLKLEGNPRAAYWIGGVFGALALLFWRFGKPSWALAAAGVMGVVVGSEILGRLFEPSQVAENPAPTQIEGNPTRQIPDRSSSNAPIPTQRTGVNIQGNRAAAQG